MHGCKLLHKHSKVKIGSRERSAKPGIGIVHHLLVQTHHLLSSRPQNLPKTNNLGATPAQITYGDDFILLQKHSNLKHGSQARILKTGTEIVHGILSQLQLFLPNFTPNFDKKLAAPGLSWPTSHMCMAQIAVDALQSQNWFMRKVHKAWDESRTWSFHPNTSFAVKLTPNFVQNKKIGAALAKITCVHSWRLLQKNSKVKLGSQARIQMTGMGILDDILS